MEAHFAKFFREQLHSRRRHPPSAAQSLGRPQELTRFPGHLIVLKQSPYFVAQGDFEEQQQQPQQQVANPSRSRSRSPVRTRSTVSASSSKPSLSGRPPRNTNITEDDSGRSARASLVLTLENSAHETAAVAVIGSMYGVRSAIGDLQQAELLYAVQLADMLGIESAITQAVQLLREAAVATSGLLPETLDALALLPSWPSCLLPLVPDIVSIFGAEWPGPSELLHSISPRNRSIRKVLVSLLGNLEYVWQQPDLRDMLLSMPVQAMQLLLSADELIVHSEDTVLYTAKKYIAAQLDIVHQTAAVACLSSIVRVPHLSTFQLHINQHKHSSCRLLEPYRDLLLQLSHIHRIRPTAEGFKSQVQRMGPGVPSSWLQGSRRVEAVPLEGVKMTWQLPVAELKAAFDSTRTGDIISPFSSPPFAGVDWVVFWKMNRDTDGTLFGLFALFSCPPGVYSRVTFRLEVKAAAHQSWSRKDSSTFSSVAGCDAPDCGMHRIM